MENRAMALAPHKQRHCKAPMCPNRGSFTGATDPNGPPVAQCGRKTHIKTLDNVAGQQPYTNERLSTPCGTFYSFLHCSMSPQHHHKPLTGSTTSCFGTPNQRHSILRNVSTRLNVSTTLSQTHHGVDNLLLWYA